MAGGVGEEHEAHVAAGAVPEGGDRGLIHPPGDQVAFPVPDPLPLRCGREPVLDQQGGGR